MNTTTVSKLQNSNKLKILPLDLASFETHVLSSKGPALVLFHAEWCGPCRMQKKAIEEMIQEISPTGPKKNLVLGSVDVDLNEDLAKRFEVNTLPTVLLFSSGTMVEALVGFQSKDFLKSYLDLLYQTISPNISNEHSGNQ